MIKVERCLVMLTPLEVQIAKFVGGQRQEQAAGRANQRDLDPAKARIAHELGAAGQMVVYKHFGRYWEPPINTFQRVDGNGLKVTTRGSEWDRAGWLPIPPDLPDRARVVMVTFTGGTTPQGGREFRIAGWITAQDGKAVGPPLALAGRRPTHCVPQDRLLPIDALLL
jgi:hypothetical protein